MGKELYCLVVWSGFGQNSESKKITTLGKNVQHLGF